MLKRRNLIVIIMTIVLTMSLLPAQIVMAHAVRFGDTASVPNSFWQLWTSYESALAENNSTRITETGERIIAFWLNGASAEQRASEWLANPVNYGYAINQLWSVSQAVSRHYEILGDISNTLRMSKISLAFVDAYKALTPHIGGNPDDMEFARTRLQNQIEAYDVTIDLYAELRDDSGTVSFNNAKYEPRSGVVFGEPPVPAAVLTSPKKPSSTIIYVLYEYEDMRERVEHDLRTNQTQGYELDDYYFLQIAWNFKEEGKSLAAVPSHQAKVTESVRYLASLNVPILLRIGAEVDVWEEPANPQEFITAFRFIADIVRREAPNVATLWSVNSVSAEGLNHGMFYPGDQYVDWVGISLYTSKYFLGRENTDDVTAAIYRTGKFANPINSLRSLVEKYGDRKPIIISEGAVSLWNNSNSENLTEWALPRIRQTYSYIPMLFPEVKAMFWFNISLDSEAQRWGFASSPAAKELYGKLTSSDYFIGKSETQSSITYKKLGTATMPANAVTVQIGRAHV